MPTSQTNTIIHNTFDDKAAVALYAIDGKIWLNQMQMAELFATSRQVINNFTYNSLYKTKLITKSVVKDFFTPSNTPQIKH